MTQTEKVFMAAPGYDLPKRPCGLWGPLIKYMRGSGDHVATFKVEGAGTNSPTYKADDPKLQKFATWLKETRGFKGS